MTDLSTALYTRQRAAEILVVDDDPRLAAWLTRVLEREGYAVRTAGDGRAALEALERALPALLLLDLLLPRIDGFEVAARLKQAASTQRLPILLMSGAFARRAREVEARLGIGVLAKPFGAETLCAEVRRRLARPRPEAARPRADEVDLAGVPAAELIYRAIEEDFCGALYFCRADVRKALVLQGGELAGVYSNQVEECLGQRLRQAGRISAAALEESIRRVRAQGCRQGAALVEMGDLSAHELESALQEQAQQKLLDVFAWEQGRAWLQSGIRELSAATPARGLSTERLMRAGVARTPPGRLRALLERHAAQTIEIRPADLADLEPEDTLRSLESGFSVGALMLAQPHATYRGWRSGRLRLNTRGDAAPCPARDLGAELRACSEQDLFHVLGLDLDAETAEVEAAFAARARAYAAERLGGASRRERQAAEQIRARLAKAHALLRERAQREAYRERLLVQDDEVDSSASLTAAVCQQAELARAELELRSGDTAAARVTLERMLRAVPHSPEASALYAWVLFLESRCDARRVQQALEIARRAVSCEPALPQPLYYLAMLYRARGKTVRARVLFRRVLGLDPTHAEARRELDRLGDG